MASDPFEDSAPSGGSEVTWPEPGPTVTPTEDGKIKFFFNSAPGYDRIGASVEGTPEFVAKSFAVEDFDGRVSSLMRRAVEVDQFFKRLYQGDSGKN